ncbi:phosphatidic acid phosphatase (PAP2) family protein [Tasmannia lanceolata]|uniref:phosphatidic acid phosphatase (PAP2) family protein n=1 Tax=Tasmannia lanceolata TaxID=3420 RepID=UPI004062B43E
MGEPSKPSLTPTTNPPSPSLLHRLINLDTTCSLHIHTICQPIPRSLLKALEISGDGRFWFPIPIALFLSPLSSKSLHLRSILLLLFIGSLLDLLIVGSLKYLIRRPRPIYNKGMHLTVSVDHWSFPSGHSSRVCFISSLLYLSSQSLLEDFSQLSSFGWIDSDGEIVRFLLLILILWSGATSISRVLLGRHFMFDVIAGAVLGIFEALFVFYVLNF